MDVDGISLASCDPHLNLPIHPSPPISRLPAEILENIFIHNAHDSYIHKAYSHPIATTPNWVNVSYVSRHWRDIAFNCQTLWTYIPTISLRWTQELLVRSQKAPLKICIELPFDTRRTDILSRILSIVEQLMDDSQRIQELHLNFVDVAKECNYRILSKFLSSPLPCLQHLEISNFSLSDDLSSFPFEVNTPALRTLMLKDCCMPWDSLELSALTTFHLHFTVTEFPFLRHISMSELLAILRRMPHLVQLSVHDILPSAHDLLSSGELNATPTINLSRLSDMSISDYIWTANALLSCVDIPLTTKVMLELECNVDSVHDDLTRLASLLGQRINPSYDPALGVPKFRSLTIGNNSNIWAMLSFSMSECECSFPSSVFSHGTDENTHLWVNFDVSFTGPGAISSHMCPSIPLTNIRSIHFVRPISRLKFWRNTLASFPNVRHIKLTECDMKMASILSLPSQRYSGNKDDPVDGDQNMVLVPALEELELDRITFSMVDLVSDLDILCEAISTRKETQCRLTIKESRLNTNGDFEGLELVGWWEDTQLKVTRTSQQRDSFSAGLKPY